MTRPRRSAYIFTLGLLVVIETAVLARGYAVRGTIWHYLVHSTVGAGLGLAAGAALAVGLHRPINGWAAAVVGQAISIVPDLMFLFGRMPHERWMDVFFGHISVHTGPQPLLIGLAVFLVGGWAWLAATLDHRITALSLAGLAALILAAALALHVPLPTRLSDYSTRFHATGSHKSSVPKSSTTPIPISLCRAR